MKYGLLAAGAALALMSTPAAAGPEAFSNGPVFTAGGAVAKIDSELAIPASTDFKVAFDVGSGKPNSLNNGIDTAARFVNMMAGSGVPVANLHPAIVVHNSAIYDVTNAARYGAQYDGAANPTADLVAQLIAKGVPIYVCGQTAAMLDVKKSDLLPGVKMATSAITAHAILARQGYTLNPF